MEPKTLRSRIAGLAVALMILVPALASAQTRVKPGFNMFSVNQDVQVGQQSAAQVNRELPLVRDARANDYVNRIGARLVAAAPGPRFPYQFRIVNASDINAFALPGGYVYVNRGVLDTARNDGEVASVLAHEIAHVALRHGTRNATRAYGTQIGANIVGALLGARIHSNAAAEVVNIVGGLGLNAILLRNGRGAESEADVLGAQIMTRAGYNPQDMVNFFGNLERMPHSRKMQWLSDHPAPENRIARIQREAQLMGVPLRSTGRSGELNYVQASLRRLPPARTTEQIMAAYGYR